MKNVSKSLTAGLLFAVSIFALSAGILPVLAQDDGAPVPARGNRLPPPPDTTPLPELNMPAIINGLGLAESKLPAREFIKGWHKPKKILVEVGNNVHRLDWLKEVVPPDVQLIALKGREAPSKEMLADADAYIGGCSKAVINASGPNLHWVQSNGVGMEGCFGGADVPAKLRDGTVAVTNSAKLEASIVASHAIASMMALSRGLDEYARMDLTGKFTNEPYPRLESLQGKTILIAGLGGIGTDEAKLAHGLGMRVIATNASIPADRPDYVDHIGLPNELGSMIGQANVVMSALPLTPETTKVFDAAMFAKMKKGVIFVNDAREEEEDDDALIAALKTGQVSAAALDLAPAGSPLIGMKNVLATPHVAAQNVDPLQGRDSETIWAVARENLRRFVVGDKMINVVDPVKGY